MATLRTKTLLLVCLPLMLALQGCPATTAAAPGSVPANATAPATQAAAAQSQQTQQTAQIIAANQRAQQIQALISKAEDAYKSGVANYNANRLDAARLDFDFAVDTMLASPFDLKTEPALSDEFEHLIYAINSLEMVALRQGNGFSPKLEAAPAENAEEVTFSVDPALVGKISAELKTTQSDLPLVINEFVAGWISAYTNSPGRHATLKRALQRAGKYKDLITRILRENGVPEDLIYQAITESGFQPQALNRGSGAGGMWQFMASNDYLKRNGYFDERFDVEKSTVAYAKYMKSLYNQFGDWYLAMAAYDWGPGRVQRAVSRTGYADYWDLYRHGNLPAETKAYIPSVIAAIIMAKNPTQYGLTDLIPDAAVLSDKVTTNYSIDLKLVADVTGSTVADIVALNPSLLRLSTPRDISYDLHIPAGTLDVYNERLKDIPEDKRAAWRFHIVKPGESLETIATSMHAHAAEIASLNDVTAAKPLKVDDELVVPLTVASAGVSGQQRYKVRRGDTLVAVADRFNVTPEDVRSWNGMKSGKLVPGKTIYVAEPIRLAPGTHATRGRSKRGRAAAAKAARGKRATSATSAARTHTAKSHTAAKTSGSKSAPAKKKKRR